MLCLSAVAYSDKKDSLSGRQNEHLYAVLKSNVFSYRFESIYCVNTYNYSEVRQTVVLSANTLLDLSLFNWSQLLKETICPSVANSLRTGKRPPGKYIVRKCVPFRKDGKTNYVRDRAWFIRLYGEIIHSFSEWIIYRTGAQTMLYLTCTMISSVDIARYGESLAEDLGIWGL